MAKKVRFDTSFNFGANRKPKARKGAKAGKGKARSGRGGAIGS